MEDTTPPRTAGASRGRRSAPPTIAMVVPSLGNAWGVASVAGFIMRTILERTDDRLKVISLAMSQRDETNSRLGSPATWRRGPTTREGDFRGQPYVHVGASLAEIETRRYLPRAALAEQLEGVDLIQMVCGTPPWARAVLGLGVPVALQVATLTEVERAAKLGTYGPAERAIRQLVNSRVAALETPALRGCASVQVENPWMRQHVEAVTQGAGTEVVMGTPGVDAAQFHPPAARPAAPGYILSVGRMRDPRKNHALLLEAYAGVTARLDNPPRLVLAGLGTPTPEFEARAATLGLAGMIDVHERPETAKIVALYRGARAFALTSEEEGFGVAVIEAMASGTPAVVTRSGGPEGIITDGHDGFLADCGDAATLADRLARVVSDDDLQARISNNARATVERRFTEQAAGGVFLGVYERLLGHS